MLKVLVERERYHGDGGKSKPHKGYDKNKEIDDLPSLEGMSRRSGKEKHSSFNYSILRRFLEKNVNRLWNDVYSEICRNISKKSKSGIWIHENLWWIVRKNVSIINDTPHYLNRYAHGFVELNNNDLYICPKTGLLRIHKCSKKVSTEKKEVTLINVSDTIRYEKIDGIWYEVTVVSYESNKVPYDLIVEFRSFSDSSVKSALRKHHGLNSDGSCVYAIKKRQLNKREIKKYILPNL